MYYLTLDFNWHNSISSKTFFIFFLGCNQTYSEPNGRIASPRWPLSSPGNTVCEFVINAQNSRTISVYARAFKIRSDANCSSAYLEVWSFVVVVVLLLLILGVKLWLKNVTKVTKNVREQKLLQSEQKRLANKFVLNRSKFFTKGTKYVCEWKLFYVWPCMT